MKEDSSINPHFESLCQTCHWYLGNKKCPAWKDEIIPKEIWEGEHSEVLKEQEIDIILKPKGNIL